MNGWWFATIFMLCITLYGTIDRLCRYCERMIAFGPGEEDDEEDDDDPDDGEEINLVAVKDDDAVTQNEHVLKFDRIASGNRK
jgi:hypothetical protein